MSVPKRGLGRGLGALLGDAPAAGADGRGTYRSIAVDVIRPNPQQPRTSFDPAALDDLARSIRELGVLVPVIVRAGANQTFELIAGERRWRAATLAGLREIPALVKSADDRSSLEIAIVENLQRSDLDPLEEAMGYAHLIDDYGFTQERVAERIGKGRPTISNALRLLTLSDTLKAKLRDRTISVGHARALLAFAEHERDAVVAAIVRDGLTVRDVERLAQRRNGPRAERATTSPATPAKSADLGAAEDRLRFALAAPVAIVPGPRGGRLEIRYADDADLMRIVDVLVGEDA